MKRNVVLTTLVGLSAGCLLAPQAVYAGPVVDTPCRIVWDDDRPDTVGLCDTYILGGHPENHVIFMNNDWMFKFLTRDAGRTFEKSNEEGKNVYVLKNDRYGRASFEIGS